MASLAMGCVLFLAACGGGGADNSISQEAINGAVATLDVHLDGMALKIAMVGEEAVHLLSKDGTSVHASKSKVRSASWNDAAIGERRGMIVEIEPEHGNLVLRLSLRPLSSQGGSISVTLDDGRELMVDTDPRYFKLAVDPNMFGERLSDGLIRLRPL
jgi:hypothetical protein